MYKHTYFVTGFLKLDLGEKGFLLWTQNAVFGKPFPNLAKLNYQIGAVSLGITLIKGTPESQRLSTLNLNTFKARVTD